MRLEIPMKSPRAAIIIVIAVAAFASVAMLRFVNIQPVSDPAPGPLKIPQRIIPLKPSITEILFAIGHGRRVVAVTDYCTYPPEAENLPRIGGLYNPNIEAIHSLKPDLVIMTKSFDELEKQLNALGIRTATINQQETIEDIIASITEIAEACGDPEAGAEIPHRIETQLDMLRAQEETGDPLRTLITVSRDLTAANVGDVYAAGPETYLSELLQIAGGENVVEAGAVRFPSLSAEAIIRLDPEVIIELAPGVAADNVTPEAVRNSWQSLPDVQAVKHGNIYVLVDDLYVRPGPRIADIAIRFDEIVRESRDRIAP